MDKLNHEIEGVVTSTINDDLNDKIRVLTTRLYRIERGEAIGNPSEIRKQIRDLVSDLVWYEG